MVPAPLRLPLPNAAPLRRGLSAAVGAPRAVAQVLRLLAGDIPLGHQVEELEEDTADVVPVTLPALAFLRAVARADLIEAAALVACGALVWDACERG